ncbi:NifB/NifX family molybdenum-iron cluster-binding protein [Thermodesulfovibrio yellowstonii]|uniref:Iron-molybdenum cofactor-binding protein n=1 Tax=Thermodesulfovibrio yellowstonii (strain ATCC 51303 / DSM 11347 / YP87) TaxID=289376 RepID=B5YHR6_THEYD|nr:NifB/NifX family molybdenum-iron cluster-binding protein [Thermodesulfovibrio yellowstonii]ACI21902.1 iron-molybdenum cofactor-binding protein [Thermodesulfovibrio yellowstonii DSM 11347]
MRLAIATENGHVAQHFGRCPGFTVVDIENGKINSKNFIENPGYKAHQPGAVPMFLRNQNVDCVIAGGMGPNAVMNLQASGIKVIVGITGSIDETIEQFLNGSLKGGESLCEHGQHEHEGCKH